MKDSPETQNTSRAARRRRGLLAALAIAAGLLIGAQAGILSLRAEEGVGREAASKAPGEVATLSPAARDDRVETVSYEPRDLLVELWPGAQDRINTAYSYGGVELARDVVEGLTGIPIDHYAIVDFKGFEEVIDAMGGVEVDVEDEVPPKYEIRARRR